jgi:hypothetical protein
VKLKITKTQLVNAAYAVVCGVAALGAETDSIPCVPEKWKHHVAAASIVALWLKSHWNFSVNPNGTPASQPYAGAVDGQR